MREAETVGGLMREAEEDELGKNPEDGKAKQQQQTTEGADNKSVGPLPEDPDEESECGAGQEDAAGSDALPGDDFGCDEAAGCPRRENGGEERPEQSAAASVDTVEEPDERRAE